MEKYLSILGAKLQLVIINSCQYASLLSLLLWYRLLIYCVERKLETWLSAREASWRLPRNITKWHWSWWSTADCRLDCCFAGSEFWSFSFWWVIHLLGENLIAQVHKKQCMRQNNNLLFTMITTIYMLTLAWLSIFSYMHGIPYYNQTRGPEHDIRMLGRGGGVSLSPSWALLHCCSLGPLKECLPASLGPMPLGQTSLS